MTIAALVSRFDRLWILVIPPLIAPLLVAAYRALEPLNPYQNILADAEGCSEKVPKDTGIQTLLFLLASRDAKLFTLRTSIRMSVLLVTLITAVAMFSHPVTRSFDPSQDTAWILMATFLLFGMCVGIDTQLLLRWAFRRLAS